MRTPGRTRGSAVAALLVAVAGAACGSVAYVPRDQVTPSPPSTSMPASTATPPAADVSSVAPRVDSVAAPPASSSARPRFACAPPDRGFGSHAPFVTRGKWKISVPAARPPSHAYDVVIHFHFSDAARRTIVHAAPDVVIVGFDLGEGSKVYGDAMSDARAFAKLLADVEGELRVSTSDPQAKLGRIALSSWSAGFGATTKILKHHRDKIDAVLFLDSLYAPYEKDAAGELRTGHVFAPALSGVVAFAEQAKRGERVLFLSTSNAPTTGYASTREVVHWLLPRVKLSLPDEEESASPLVFDHEGVHVRMHGGNSAEAHCFHLGLAGDAVALWRAARAAPNARAQ